MYLQFHSSGSGIQRDEFINTCNKLGLGHLEYSEVFDIIDGDGSGAIDHEEFVEAAEGKFVSNFELKKKKFIFM